VVVDATHVYVDIRDMLFVAKRPASALHVFRIVK
jgi:hypothetical protein